MQTLADQVIDAFGGLSATAKALGHKNVTTVQGWKKTGNIPHWRHREIREAAPKATKALPEQFRAEKAA